MEVKIDLIDHMGDDLTVVNAARVSLNKESEWENQNWGHPDFEEPNYLSDKDKKLIGYLSKNGHWTPFSHCQVMIREKVPIFVARQRFKHIIGFTYNEVSRRYVDDEPEFFIPQEWRSKPVNIKQGSSNEIIEWLETGENVVWDDPSSPPLEVSIKQSYSILIEHAERLYKMMIKSGVAPEQARMILPQSMYTEYYVTGSLAAWARAYKLRIDPHAQKEIQDLAKMWRDVISPLFPESWKALTES